MRHRLAVCAAAAGALLLAPTGADAAYRDFRSPTGKLGCAFYSDAETPRFVRCDWSGGDQGVTLTETGKGKRVRITDTVMTRRRRSSPTAGRPPSAACAARRAAPASPAAAPAPTTASRSRSSASACSEAAGAGLHKSFVPKLRIPWSPSGAAVRMCRVTAPAETRSDFAAAQRAREAAWLSPLAMPSYPARRAREEADSPVRTPFQRDRDRIVHSKAFRRLKHKTQVFVAPEGDHYRTRLTHTLEVTGISRTVARALRLNEDLTEAIGLGHDVGHPPFGHIGEDVLDRAGHERHGRGFRHNEHSLRVVDVLEHLNLTEPVRDGILRHSSGAGEPATLEGKIVRLVDRIAYINHDIDDAVRAGVLRVEELPEEEIAILGPTGSARIDTLVADLVAHSEAAGDIVQGTVVGPAMLRLRSFMFEHVYLGPRARREYAKIERVLRGLFDHYCEHPEELPPPAAGATEADRVVDYLAGMTDRFAIRAWTERFVPQGLAL
jgi:dGTPase